MRLPLILFAGVLASVAATARVAPLQTTGGSPSGACITPTKACTEFVSVGTGSGRSLIYRTYPLTVRNDRIRRAMIMVHGTNRNADHYFATATGAAFLAHALDDAMVISPRIASADPNCRDVLEPNEISWSCTGDSWRSGGVAASHKELTSFDFMDALVKRLADKKV